MPPKINAFFPHHLQDLLLLLTVNNFLVVKYAIRYYNTV